MMSVTCTVRWNWLFDLLPMASWSAAPEDAAGPRREPPWALAEGIATASGCVARVACCWVQIAPRQKASAQLSLPLISYRVPLGLLGS